MADVAVATQLMSAFTAAGMTKAGAAGMIGNWTQESSLNPSAAGGLLGQWQGDRMAALQSFAASSGQPATNPTVQARFAVHELQSGYPQLWKMLQSTNDPAGAATAISQQYERPGVPMLQNRIQAAIHAMSLTGAPATTAASSPSSSGGLFAEIPGELKYAAIWAGAIALGVWMLYQGLDRSTHGAVSRTTTHVEHAAASAAKVAAA